MTFRRKKKDVEYGNCQDFIFLIVNFWQQKIYFFNFLFVFQNFMSSSVIAIVLANVTRATQTCDVNFSGTLSKDKLSPKK